MDLGGKTWIVAADGDHARVFVERSRGGDLIELEAEALRRETSEHPHGHRHLATVHDSAGPGRHSAGERDVDRDAAQRFFHSVAARLEARLHERAYDELAIFAAPRALGLLKGELEGKVAARLSVTDPHACAGDTPAQVRARLYAARAAVKER